LIALILGNESPADVAAADILSLSTGFQIKSGITESGFGILVALQFGKQLFHLPIRPIALYCILL